MFESGKKILIAVIVLAIVGAAGFLFGRNSVSDGAGTADIIAKFDEAARNQRSLTDKLDRSTAIALEINRRNQAIEARLDRIESLSEEALGRIAGSDALIQESRKLDSADERLIRAILSRDETKGK